VAKKTESYEIELPKARAQIRISVRDLVEFVLRSGDIDHSGGGVDTITAMLEGSRIHRKIQKKMGASYHAEVPLKFVITYEDYELGIEGRADGIIIEDVGVTIDEIKGVYLDLDNMSEPVGVHLAQAKCYAYIYATQNHLDEIGVQMTYCNLDTEDIRRFHEHYTYEELSDWFEGVLALYKRWADFSYYWKLTRQDSIHALEFPYAYREGQREVAGDVYRTIARNQILFMQAPTGSGKTLATIFPAVKAVGEGLGERIFYLTAKTITRVVAKDTFLLFEKQGYRGKTVEITAKDKLCPFDASKCDPKHCTRAEGHYDRINDAVYDLLQEQDVFDRDTIARWAAERNVCPFEMNLDVSSWCDNIICDYNYVFDPNVYLKRFFTEGVKSDAILLVDEAHNLVERGREMYSETLVKEEFLDMKKHFKIYNGGIPKALDRCNRILLDWKRQCDEVLLLEEMDSFLLALMRLANAMQTFFEKHIELDHMDEIREFYFKVRNFLNLSEWMDERYRIYCDFNSENLFRIHLRCMDPSRMLQERIERANACVFFSATLLPINYYKSLLCTKEDPYAIYAKTIFDTKQRKLFIGRDVTSKYTRRSKDEYRKFAEYICKIASCQKGNYMVFFPSYAFLERVYEAFTVKELATYDFLQQESGMTEEERDAFLAAFEENREKSLLAFCVMGGIFSEGIDLTRERLIGAIIVGTGLPQVSNERKLLMDYFNANGGDGFAYSYLYPGMNKVQQAAGRVIRTTEDVGVIALLDERFCFSDYRKTFPREWADVEVETLDTVEKSVTKFWEELE
jgi:Rad3-related DNA helicase